MDEAANVVRYVNDSVQKQSKKLKRASSKAVVNLVRGFKRHSIVPGEKLSLKEKQEMSVCLGYAVVRSSDGAFDSTTNGRRRRLLLEYSRKGRLVLRTWCSSVGVRAWCSSVGV